jgi:hypothetical protein
MASNPLPLPEITVQNWTGRIDSSIAKEAFEIGRSNLADLQAQEGIPAWIKEFHPTAHHRAEDADEFGSSRFLPDKLGNFSKLPSLKDSDIVEIHPGHGGPDRALTFIVTTTEEVGTWWPIEAKPVLVWRRLHGCMQPVLELPPARKTNIWTFVLTDDHDGNGWLLASCYPGLPDPDPDPSVNNKKDGEPTTLEETDKLGARVKIVRLKE